jgi:hypothetical protein
MKYQLIGYFRHVDDILIIYNQKKTNKDETLAELNKHKTNIKLTIEKEQHNSTDFLDLTIHRKKIQLEFAIYRKHTKTDFVIKNDSCHPYEHKISSINYLMNSVQQRAKGKGLNIIKRTT